MRIVSIGIPKLDSILGKGIPSGFTVLVKGAPGSGGELFAKQFASVRDGAKSVAYFSTDERMEELYTTMEKFNWSTDFEVVDISTAFYEEILAKELEANRLRREGLRVSELTKLTGEVLHSKTPFNFLADLQFRVTKLDTPFRLVIDSVDFYLLNYSTDEVLAGLRSLKALTQHTDSNALITMTTGVHDSQVESGVDNIADIIIEMEIQRMASEFESRLVVKKFRNHPDKTAILTFSLSEKGITPEMIARVA